MGLFFKSPILVFKGCYLLFSCPSTSKPSTPFEIEIDSSQFSIDMILKQGGDPIAYYLETLVDEKRN